MNSSAVRTRSTRRLLAIGLAVITASIALLGATAPGATSAPRRAAQASHFYFAEGYTGPGWQVYLCVGNPNTSDASVAVTFFVTDEGDVSSTIVKNYDVRADSRVTVHINEVAGYGNQVSMEVSSESYNLIAERPMYFDYRGKWVGGHDAVGAPGPANQWYFAEGTTREGFEEWITVLNTESRETDLTFRYMIEGQGEEVHREKVAARARGTFLVSDHVGMGKDVSLLLEADGGVVAERPMYFDYKGMGNHGWKGGHCVMGAMSPLNQWCFAEGTTRDNFEQWLCIQNINVAPITVDAVYYFGAGQGPALQKAYQVGALQRLTVPVNREVGPGKDVSCMLTSDEGAFIAERPLYFNYEGTWAGGSDVMGASAPARKWAFAEGFTGPGFVEYLTIWNSGAEPTPVQIVYYPEAGEPIVKYHEVGAQSRYTVVVNADAGPNLSVSATVTANTQVVVERPMYFDYNGEYDGGHCVMGSPCPT